MVGGCRGGKATSVRFGERLGGGDGSYYDSSNRPRLYRPNNDPYQSDKDKKKRRMSIDEFWETIKTTNDAKSKMIWSRNPNHVKSPCVHDEKNFRCVKYIKTYDADTITVDIPNVHSLIGNKINIRVMGIDAPELDSKNYCEEQKAIKAKQSVEDLLKKAKRIDLEEVARDKYFRIVSNVKIDGESLSDYLLKEKLVRKYDGKIKKEQQIDWCKPI